MSDFIKMLSYKKGDGHTWRPEVGTTCLISPPNCDNGDGYVYHAYEVLWLDQDFICYRKDNCWPVVNKWEHIRAKPLPPAPTEASRGEGKP